MGLLDTPGDAASQVALTVDQQIALRHAKAAEKSASQLEAIVNYLFSVQAAKLEGINASLSEDFRRRYGCYPYETE